MSNRCKYPSVLRNIYLVVFFGIIFIFSTISCVTDAKVGEFSVPSTYASGSGGSEGIGVTEGLGGSGGFETNINNGGNSNGGENGLGFAATGGSVPIRDILCTAKDNFDDFEVIPCDQSFATGTTELERERQWIAIGEDPYAWGPPLVANLTDDNGDGDVDLCDSPDILIVEDLGLFCLPLTDCTPLRLPIISLIDGKEAKLHEPVVFDETVYPGTTPAIGDIDRDGFPDVIAASRTSIASQEFLASVIAFKNDGTVKWKRPTSESLSMKVETLAITLANLDNKGEAEVIAGFDVFDGKGNHIIKGDDIVKKLGATFFFDGLRVAPVAADLDGDRDLEVIIGPVAFYNNGEIYYTDTSGFSSDAASVMFFLATWGIDERPIYSIYPLVANLDDDSAPEVLFTAASKVYILENDGHLKRKLDLSWLGIEKIGPPTVHDFTGDGKPEIAFDTSRGLVVYDRNLEERLMNRFIEDDPDPGCVSAFDFQGDGVAELIYSDGHFIRLIDVTTGEDIASFKREGSKDCAVVADVDADGRAEIVFVNQTTAAGDAPSVQIIGERYNRWVPTRRIWNEHNYHVTNVLEDSTIPDAEPRYWEHLNTFRANVQVESEDICSPNVIIK